MSNVDIFNTTLDACAKVNHTRKDVPDILASLVEEVGELATEVQISRGIKNREPGPDGVIGEAVDVILCAVDLIFAHARDNNTLLSQTDMISLKNIILNTIQYKTDKWLRGSRAQDQPFVPSAKVGDTVYWLNTSSGEWFIGFVIDTPTSQSGWYGTYGFKFLKMVSGTLTWTYVHFPALYVETELNDPVGKMTFISGDKFSALMYELTTR